MNKSTILIIILSILIGIFIGWGIKPTPEPVKPEIRVDTVYTAITIRDTIYKPRFYNTKDTIYITQLDTFYIENYYVAEVDTVFEDDLLSGKVSFISDIPLSQDSYFKMSFNVKTKEVIRTITIPEEPSFWYKRFVPYLGVGLSLTQENKVEPSIQLGIGIRLN